MKMRFDFCKNRKNKKISGLDNIQEQNVLKRNYNKQLNCCQVVLDTKSGKNKAEKLKQI